MNVKEQLRNNFPTTIKKNGYNFNALVANDTGTAVIEKEITDLINYMKEWRNTKDIYSSTGTIMTYIADFYTYLTQFTDETDKNYLTRIKAIFNRNDDMKWGSPFDIINTFRSYFITGNIFLCENTDEKDSNLLKDYFFDEASLQTWNFVNAILDDSARFVKTNGVILSGENSNISQEVSVEKDKTYILHAFVKGNVQLSVEGAKWKKWNNVKEEYEDIIPDKEFHTEDWEDVSIVFIATEENVKIKISNIEGESWVDYPRLFVKKSFPSFTIYVQFTGDSSVNALALAPGEADPSDSIPHYDKVGYFDQSFLSGANSGYALDLYEELLSYVKSIGVKAYLEIVNRDSDKS